MPTRTATGHFTYADWEERPAGPADALPRLAQATVANTFSGGIEAAGTVCAYTIAYLTATTGSYSGTELLAGSLDGRKGGFALEERGTFHEDGTTRCSFAVVPGSGTGELTGLRGTGSFLARHGEPSVPYTFEYDLD
ncbi:MULTISPECIES: DUF3224 domain-containing protein [Streptomyces]|uniref:DUF3224 domain-containing protein n=1 Tax=Streptomyces katrae TaxID=68223 RepID=A0ABT7H7I0_9ACTN|nr:MULTISPECIES: DUF3224 domain-containing protein [Streptomyces]MDK9501389.1 DUF3224 domain-containing protein [Streptomyces katrae]GLX23355.1 hypothetical protein Slala01_69990 [Streptomyces lavendulae subsp. lavendulae]GLX31349.1 hypothetical protein Slala02_71680 [Streptomyces lavendulae subsp. lavendulae]